jgi:hypothetical protein
MSYRKYVAAIDNRLPQPKFTPGIDSRATSVLLLAGTTFGLATVFLLPSSQGNSDSAIYDAQPEQVIIVDQAPRFVQGGATSNSATIPYSEHASLVSSALGLGKSDVARILGISRPTLYSWIKGNSEPRESDHPERLRKLGELTAEICKESKRPLYHRFVEEPLPNQPVSIFNLLLSDNWDIAELRKLFVEARRLTSERDQRLGHATPINISKAKQESNLLENSIALNLE